MKTATILFALLAVLVGGVVAQIITTEFTSVLSVFPS